MTDRNLAMKPAFSTRTIPPSLPSNARIRLLVQSVATLGGVAVAIDKKAKHGFRSVVRTHALQKADASGPDAMPQWADMLNNLVHIRCARLYLRTS